MIFLIPFFQFSFAYSQDDLIEREIQLDNIKVLKVSGLANISLEQGTSNSLFIKSSTQDYERIEHSQNNGTLNIDVSGTESGYTIKVVLVDLDEIEADDVSRIKSTTTLRTGTLKIEAEGTANINLNLEVEELITEISGACVLKLSGKANTHKIDISGASNINAQTLETQNTEINISGAGIANLNVTNNLSGSISGFGNIFYVEEPSNVNVETSGLGSVRKAGAGTTSQENSDTTRIRIGQSEVLILSDEDDEENGIVERKKFDGHWGGVGLGLNLLTDNNYKLDMPVGYGFLDIKMSKSIALNLNIYEQNFNLVKDRFGLITGLGITFNNYHFSQNIVLLPGQNSVSAVQDTVNDFIKNRLRVVYATLPIIFEVQTGEKTDLHFGAGMIMGLKIGSHTKQEYKTGDVKFRDRTYDDFNLNPFKADATVEIGWGIINLYANYSILPLFKTSKSPELYPLTFGIKVLGW